MATDELLTVCRQPVQQLMTTVAATLYPTALSMKEIEPSHPVHQHKDWRQGGHQRPEGRSSNRKIISIGTWTGLKKVWSGRISWDGQIIEPSKDRVEHHGEQGATRRAELPDTSGHEELSSGSPCKLHLRSAVHIFFKKKKTTARVDK